MIQLTGAAKRFGPKTLIENLDWLVTPNERAGIVGASVAVRKEIRRTAGRIGHGGRAVTDQNRLPTPMPPEGTGQLVLYRTEDGRTRISCRLGDDSVWLTQAAMAELFQTTPQNITLHIGAIYQEGNSAKI